MSENRRNDESPSSTSSSSSSNSSDNDSLNTSTSGILAKKDSNHAKAPVRNQSYTENLNSNTHLHSESSKVTQNNISITNINSPIHIGPSYNATIVHNTCSNGASKSPNLQDGGCHNASRKKSLSDKEKEHIRNCWKSKRVIHDDEVLAISKNVGKNWKDVGNALKFNFVKIEKWEQDANLNSDDGSGSISDAVYRMLYFWVQWKDEKATVGTLAKALYKSDEFDAFECLQP